MGLLIWWYAELERRLLVIRHHLMEEIGLMQSPLSRYYFFELCLSMIHLPPYTQMFNEFQLVMFCRLIHVVKFGVFFEYFELSETFSQYLTLKKFMREHHPMRYNRMTEVLKVVSQTKLSTSFLVKSYFLKSPGISLFIIYLFNVFIIGYIVYALERVEGTCMSYWNVTWIIVVSITNLGFGDYVPSFWISRAIIGQG